MEICFELTTNPAVKGTIAIISCVSIANIATHAQNWYGTSCAFLIGIICIVIGTYQKGNVSCPAFEFIYMLF